MNGKFEEKLAMLAFGDLSSEEARELERKAASDPEAQRALNQYRAMRAELRGLGENLPPDQLSKERLRDAILGQGLRPKPQASESRGWVWMPILAGAAAFSMFWFRPAKTVEPQVVLKTPVATKASLPEPTPFRSAGSVAMMTKSEPIKATESVRPVSRVASRSTSRKRSEPIVLEAARYTGLPTPVDDGGIPSHDLNSDPTMAASKSTGEATLVASNPESEHRGPIILIDTHKDADTGASSATEVGTASNVLVGG